MFNSISNNFGAGVIRFRDVFDKNYLILNATFTYRTDDPAYQAAETLEIKVPDLPIDRSAECGVVMRFLDRYTYYDKEYAYDGGTVLKSWIKDKNTICIEKLTAFDSHTEMIIYIQSMYLQLGQGGNATIGTRKNLTVRQAVTYLYFDYDSFVVIYDRWVFVHLMYSSCAYSYRGLDWKCILEGLPEDVKADVPLMMAYCSRTPKAGGVSLFHLEDSVFTMKAAGRPVSIDDTANYVFAYACLIRDTESVKDVEGRLRIAENPIKGDRYVQMANFDLELSPSPALMALGGSTGQYSKTSGEFYPASDPEGMPSCKTYLLGRMQNGSGLCIQLTSITVDLRGSQKNVILQRESGETSLVVKMFDTGAAMPIE